LLRERGALVAEWAGERRLILACDSAYAARRSLENRPANVQVISRLRQDAARWTSPPARRSGQKGRPRRKGRRLPTPKAAAAQCRRWRTATVAIYGRLVTLPYFSSIARWYGALREAPLRSVVVRDPAGRRQDEACFGPAVSARPTAILETDAHRGTLAVTCHDSQQCLGFEDPQNQTASAVRRTAPLAFLVYDLVLLWYGAPPSTTRIPRWPTRPGSRQKATPSCLDMLTALRHAGGRPYFSASPPATPWPQKPFTAWPDAVLATA
jgi:hypothetical protein